MNKSWKIMSVIGLIIGLTGAGWYYRNEIQNTAAPYVATIQKRIQVKQEERELQQLVECVNKDPHFTVLDVRFIPSTTISITSGGQSSSVSTKGRTISFITSYTINSSTSRVDKATSFGESHRVLFQCALETKTEWVRLYIYYVDFVPVPVIDDLDTHVSAVINLSFTTTQEFILSIIEAEDIFTTIYNAVGNPYDVPTPKVIVVDMSPYNLRLDARNLNGDRGLAIQRYQKVLGK